MRGKKAQISMEYLVIIGFVVIAILVPAFLILFSSTYKNVYGPVNSQKVLDLGNGLVNDAKQMYYLGIYSRKISQYEMPDNVDRMFILQINHNSTEYYYLGMIVNDRGVYKAQMYLSDIPLTSDLSSGFVNHDDSLSNYVKECKLLSYTCAFYNFTGTTTMPGMKKFLVETVSRDGSIKSSIVPELQ